MARGRLVVGGHACACAAPRLGPNSASRCSDKSHLLGPSPCSSFRTGGPLYGWKNMGIFAVVGTGRTGLRVCRHVGLLLAPRPHVSEPHGGRGPLIQGCRCPARVKGRRGHSPGERGLLGPERAFWKFPVPGPSGSCGLPRLLPWGLVPLTRAQVRPR